jgi:hypothetical protein
MESLGPISEVEFTLDEELMEFLQVSTIEGIRFMDLGLGSIRLLRVLVHRTGEAIDGVGKCDEGILIIRGRITVIVILVIVAITGIVGVVRVAISMARGVESGGGWSRAEDVGIVVVVLR